MPPNNCEYYYTVDEKEMLTQYYKLPDIWFEGMTPEISKGMLYNGKTERRISDFY